MKYTFLLILSLLTCISCQEVIDVDLQSESPRLVIDAAIERTYEGDSFTDSALVTLQTSSTFNNKNVSYVNDAIVELINLDTNENTILENTNDLGNYEPNASVNFSIDDTANYQLKITYNSDVYTATERLNKGVPVDSLVQEYNDNAFAPEDRKVTISFTDIADEANFYVFKIDDYNFQVIDDEFIINGESFDFQEFVEDNTLSTFKVNAWGSDKEFNRYLEAIAVLAGNQNGPFGSVPFTALGNIKNNTNKERFPYGYFHINEVYTSSLELVENSTLTP